MVNGNIAQSDSGVTLKFNISDTAGSSNIFGGIDKAVCKIVSQNITTEKNCTILDASSCSISLNSTELGDTKDYKIQLTLTYLSGAIYSTDIKKFTVVPKL